MGCSRLPHSTGCSADPNGNLTPLRGNPLWQLGLLELWLDRHVNGVVP